MAKTEYLSKDILEDQYIRSFSPFHYVELVLGISRIHLRDRFVTCPTISQKVYSLICVGLSLVFHTYITIMYFQKFDGHPSIYYTIICLGGIHYMTFLCNMIHMRFFYSVANSKFYVEMQQLDRLLKIQDCLYNMQFLYNLYTVASYTLTLIIVFICGVFLHYVIAIAYIGILYGILCSVIEWMHCANLLIYFYLRIRYINAIISNHLKGKIVLSDVKDYFLPRQRFMRHLVSAVHDLESSPVDVYVAALVHAFSSFQNLYRFQLLLFVGNFFIHSLLSFFIIVTAVQNGLFNKDTWLEYMDMPTVTVLAILIAVAISVRCELFLREVIRTRRLCINVLARYNDGVIRDKTKRILRTLDARPPSLSVYDIWEMNAGTLFAVTNIITTLMVAILQFILV